MAETRPEYGDSLARIKQAIPDSYERMEPLRKNRINILREIAGKNWSANGTPDKRALNSLEMYTTAFARQIIGRNPAVRVTPKSGSSLKVTGHQLGLAVNKTFNDIGIAAEWADAVRESFVGIGCCVYGLTHSGNTVEIEGQKVPLGRPFCRSIPADDLVLDMNATKISPEVMDYVGHYHIMPLKALKQSGIADQSQVARLSPMVSLRRRGARGSSSRASELGHGEGTRFTLRDKVELLDLAIPDQQIVITVDAEMSCDRPIMVRRMSGDGVIPYDFLWYTKIAGNLLPLPPLSNPQDLQIAMNVIFNKVIRDASEAKNLIYAQSSARRDAERVMKAPNGAVVTGMNPPEMLAQLRFRGADQSDMAFVMQCKQLANTYLGNVEGIAGMGPQSDTLGQDQMIMAAANGQIDEMKKIALDFYKRGGERIGQYIFTDPYIEMELTYRLPKFAEFEATDILRPEDLRGDFIDYNFDIVPYSATDLSPQQKLSGALSIFQVIAPHLETAAQQGEIFQIREFIRSISELANVSDVVSEWFMSSEPVEQPIGERPQKIGGNGGEYIHRNVSGTSRQGQETRQIQSMLAAGSSNENGGGSMVGA